LGLESLKSAFSDIKNFGESIDKSVEEASSIIKTDLTTMTSQYSIQTEPHTVDYMDNEKAPGFSANQNSQSPNTLFTGVSGESPNMTFSGNTNFYSNTDYGNWPGPMDNWTNDKATGFTLDQVHQSPSRFVGVGGESPNMTWTNDIELGGSIFGTSIEPQTIDYMPNDKSVGFSPNQEHKFPTKFTGAGEHLSEPYMEWTNNSLYGATDTVDFQKIDSSWTTPLTGLTFPDGFTDMKNPLTDSELARGFYGDSAVDFTNTNLYSAMGWEGTNVSFNGPTTNDYTTNTYSPSNLIPPDGTDWTIPAVTPNSPDGFTYQDSIHTTNALTGTGNEKFGGPVNFMPEDGVDVHATGFTVSGINNSLTTQFIGITDPSTKIWTPTTTYYDSLHTHNNPLMVDSISIPFMGPVDFMTGANSYYPGVNSLTTGEGDDVVTTLLGIPGFTNQFGTTTSLTAGYLEEDGSKGISNFLSRDIEGNVVGVISTGTHTQYGKSLTFTTQTNTTIDAGGGINFMDMGNTNAIGFTPWDIDVTPAFPTQFVGVDLTSNIYIKPEQTPTVHTINVEPYSTGTVNFSNQQSTGLTFNTTATDHVDAFESGLEKDIDTTHFKGFDIEANTWNPTTDYYDSIHPKNPITTAGGWTLFADQVDTGFSIEGGGGIVSFTANMTEPGSNILNAIGESGPSEFLDETMTTGDGVLTGNIIHPYNVNQNDNPIETSMLGTWSRASDVGINADGTITFGGFHIGRSGVLQSGVSIVDVYELGKGELVFETLYNDDQTVTENKFGIQDRFGLSSNLWTVDPNRVGGTAEEGIFKAAIKNIPTISIGDQTYSIGESLNEGNQTEPYVISKIGNDDTHWTNQYFPLSRIQKDVQRIGKFLSSQKGEVFTLQQELLGTFQQYKSLYDPGSTMLNIAAPKEGVGTPLVRFTRDTGAVGSLVDAAIPTTYTEWLDARSGGWENILQNVGNISTNWGALFDINDTYAEKDVGHNPLAFMPLDLVERAGDWVMDKIGLGTSPKDVAGIDKTSKIDSHVNMQTSMGTRTPLGNYGKGDIHTLFDIKKAPEDSVWGQVGDVIAEVVSGVSQTLGGGKLLPRAIDLETSKEGMPFYFKDLRDKKVIHFRAYLEGISETISPNWSPTTYIGRSEPVYTYTNSEREIQFTLKLFAQTKDELNMIYKKMNRLTSMCYPEYQKFEDPNFEEMDITSLNILDIVKGISNTKERMKPPLTKFRLGELFGSKGKEMTGFIKSLSYSYPDESPWEIKQGQRVPKYITVDIGYQVIHSTVPSLDFAPAIPDSLGFATETPENTFYGINQNLGG